MNNKRLDGIKRLPRKKDTKKSKEIVLEAIDDQKITTAPKKAPQRLKKKKEIINIKSLYEKKYKKKTEIKLNVLSFKKTISFLVTFILLFVIFYFLFILAVLRFDLDNGATRYINNYLPVPAIISEEGIMNYYDYKDSEEEIREFFKKEDKYKLFLL